MVNRMGWMVVLVVAGLVVAGCGGGDEASTEAAGAPTLRDWVTQADEICVAGDLEIDQVAQETFSEGQPSAEEEKQFVTETVLPNVESQVEDVTALPRPEGADGDRVTEFVEIAQEEYDAFAEDPSVAEGQGDPFAESAEQGQELGLQECAT